MVRAGVDVVRVNFSHGALADHRAASRWCATPRARRAVTSACSATCRGRSPHRPLRERQGDLADGADFTLDACLAVDAGDGRSRRSSTYKSSGRLSVRGVCAPAERRPDRAWRSPRSRGRASSTRVLVGVGLGNNRASTARRRIVRRALADEEPRRLGTRRVARRRLPGGVLPARRSTWTRRARCCATPGTATRWSRRSSAWKRSRIWPSVVRASDASWSRAATWASMGTPSSPACRKQIDPGVHGTKTASKITATR